MNKDDSHRLPQKINELLLKINELEENLKDVDKKTNTKCDKVGEDIRVHSEDIYTFADKRREREKRFDENTKLHKDDYCFIMFCTALQILRQFYLTDFKERLDNKTAAEKIKEGIEEHSNRKKRRYYCSIQDIISNPVPFDAIQQKKGLQTGISGANHRYVCLGHYPDWGYLFGTANILTSTVTKKVKILGVSSYHVETKTFIRNYKNGLKNIKLDNICSKAHTALIFKHCYLRIKKNPKEGILALITALGKEHKHLMSDLQTKQSIPFPFLSFSPEIAKYLGDCGLDSMNATTISEQAYYCWFVNFVTQILYFAYRMGKIKQENPNIPFYQIGQEVKVKSLKIINVANVLSTSSNLITTIIGLYTENAELMRKFDIGGNLSMLAMLSKSADIMIQIEESYVNS